MLKRFFEMKEDNLDERELQIRGIIYRNSFLLTVSLLLINTSLLAQGILWGSAGNCNMVTLLTSVVVMCCAQLWQGIYPVSRLAQKGLCIMLVIYGVFSLGAFVYDIAAGEAFLNGAALTDTGVALIMGVLCLLPMVFYVLARKRLAAEE